MHTALYIFLTASFLLFCKIYIRIKHQCFFEKEDGYHQKIFFGENDDTWAFHAHSYISTNNQCVYPHPVKNLRSHYDNNVNNPCLVTSFQHAHVSHFKYSIFQEKEMAFILNH